MNSKYLTSSQRKKEKRREDTTALKAPFSFKDERLTRIVLVWGRSYGAVIRTRSNEIPIACLQPLSWRWSRPVCRLFGIYRNNRIHSFSWWLVKESLWRSISRKKTRRVLMRSTYLRRGPKKRLQNSEPSMEQ